MCLPIELLELEQMELWKKFSAVKGISVQLIWFGGNSDLKVLANVPKAVICTRHGDNQNKIIIEPNVTAVGRL